MANLHELLSKYKRKLEGLKALNTIGMSDKWHINQHGQLTHET